MLCFLYLNIKFQLKGEVRIALTRIFGVGLQRASYVCDLLGLSKNFKMSHINKYKISLLIGLIKKYYGIELVLRRIRFNRLKRFLSLKSYNSMRIKFGLPIRGQKTHNNARTPKNRVINLSSI